MGEKSKNKEMWQMTAMRKWQPLAVSKGLSEDTADS